MNRFISDEDLGQLYEQVSKALGKAPEEISDFLQAVPAEIVLETEELIFKEPRKGIYRPCKTKEIKVIRITPQKVIKPRKHKKRIRNRAWLMLRADIIKEKGSLCELCQSPANHVHHIQHVATHPHLQLERSNLLLLCMSCHRLQHLDLPQVLFTAHLVHE